VELGLEQAVFTVIGDIHGVAFFTEPLGEEARDLPVVFDNEDSQNR